MLVELALAWFNSFILFSQLTWDLKAIKGIRFSYVQRDTIMIVNVVMNIFDKIRVWREKTESYVILWSDQPCVFVSLVVKQLSDPSCKFFSFYLILRPTIWQKTKAHRISDYFIPSIQFMCNG